MRASENELRMGLTMLLDACAAVTTFYGSADSATRVLQLRSAIEKLTKTMTSTKALLVITNEVTE